MKAFEGKTAVITGGAQGIGKAIADAFIREGAAVRIIEKVCRTFDDYDGSPRVFDEARRELLETLG